MQVAWVNCFGGGSPMWVFSFCGNCLRSVCTWHTHRRKTAEEKFLIHIVVFHEMGRKMVRLPETGVKLDWLSKWVCYHERCGLGNSDLGTWSIGSYEDDLWMSGLTVGTERKGRYVGEVSRLCALSMCGKEQLNMYKYTHSLLGIRILSVGGKTGEYSRG